MRGEKVHDGALSPEWLCPSDCSAGRKKRAHPGCFGQRGVVACVKTGVEGVNEVEW